jgi:hypothetical protein
MKIKPLVLTALTLTAGLYLPTAGAYVLNSSNQCSAGNADAGIDVGNVSRNLGGASDCWGRIKGNDPGPSGSGIDRGAQTYEFVTKFDVSDGGGLTHEGLDIGLGGTGFPGASGTWFYDPARFSADSFMIVLKAGNGWASYLFDGGDAASYGGDWTIGWGKAISHFSVYATDTSVPEPAALMLLGFGLLGLGLARRRR